MKHIKPYGKFTDVQLATPGNISSTDVKEFDDFMKYQSWQKVKIQSLLFVVKKEI